MRAGKGFETVECYTGLKNVKLPAGCVVLLECMSNLVANEMFEEQGAHNRTVSEVTKGIENLLEQGFLAQALYREFGAGGHVLADGQRHAVHLFGDGHGVSVAVGHGVGQSKRLVLLAQRRAALARIGSDLRRLVCRGETVLVDVQVFRQSEAWKVAVTTAVSSFGSRKAGPACGIYVLAVGIVIHPIT